MYMQETSKQMVNHVRIMIDQQMEAGRKDASVRNCLGFTLFGIFTMKFYFNGPLETVCAVAAFPSIHVLQCMLPSPVSVWVGSPLFGFYSTRARGHCGYKVRNRNYYFGYITVYTVILPHIRSWLNIACQQSMSYDGQDVVRKAVQSMIPDSISIVTSRYIKLLKQMFVSCMTCCQCVLFDNNVLQGEHWL